MQPDDSKVNDEDKQEKIKGGEDGAPPFSEPTDVSGPDDRNAYHPVRDSTSDIDSTEEYNEGPDVASGVEKNGPDEDDRAIRIA
jgi:hypothetical protein